MFNESRLSNRRNHVLKDDMINMVSTVDPYVVNTLKSVIGSKLLVETTIGGFEGTVADVKPDHVILKNNQDGTTKFIRIQEIVFVMPI